jgi:type IV fimbrial biogenesis protein FimT
MIVHSTSRPAGLTVLELLTVIAVVTTVLGLAVPAFRGLVTDARASAAANDFLHAVHLARQAAQVRGQAVVLCPDHGSAPCLGHGPGDWSQGWLVFVNADGDEPPVRDPDEPVLLRRRSVSPLHASANRRAFTFRPFTARDTNGTWQLCSRPGLPALRRIVISPTGRPRNASGHDHQPTSRCS